MRSMVQCLVVVLMLASGELLAADTSAGFRLYRTHCQVCHGANGRGEMAGVPDFRRGDGLLRTDRDLFVAIMEGRGTMPGYRGIFNEADAFDVIAYLRSF